MESVKITFNIEDLSLQNPKINKNMFYSKILNSNGDKKLLTIENVKFFKNSIVKNDLFTELYTTTSFELKFFILQLENKIKELYAKNIGDDDNMDFESLIRYDNMTMVSKFIINNKLTLLDNITLDKYFNITLELYSVIQNNSLVQILWKLKSLQVMEQSEFFDNDLDINDDIQAEILEQKKEMLDTILTNNNELINKCNIQDEIYNKISSENNIDIIYELYDKFLKIN
jgi:hypothetical protein